MASFIRDIEIGDGQKSCALTQFYYHITELPFLVNHQEVDVVKNWSEVSENDNELSI